MKPLFLSIFSLLLAFSAVPAKASHKKFHRALVIAGGGASPGVGLGIIAGAESMGWKPDVVITTCGASLAAMIENNYLNSKRVKAFLTTEEFHQALRDSVKIDARNVLSLKRKFSRVAKTNGLANLFTDNILYAEQNIAGPLTHLDFNRSSRGPRFIMLASQAKFGPNDVGSPLGEKSLFRQVYFTDADTGAALRGFESPIKRAYPGSRIDRNTTVITSMNTAEAARASITDPYLMNPAELDGDYYFTGAVDLFPTEMAEFLADEVLVTYPTSTFNDLEDFAIQSTFGFSQRQRVLDVVQNTKVKWIDMSGLEKLDFNPSPFLLWIHETIPRNLQNFQNRIMDQYDFGFNRVREALKLQRHRNDVRAHLRKPISKKLAKGFTCENANEWKTRIRKHCTRDDSLGCNRERSTKCTAIR